MVRQMLKWGFYKVDFASICHDAHSPVGKNPEEFGVVPHLKEITFANNDIEFQDKTELTTVNLVLDSKSLFNYMHGIFLKIRCKNGLNLKFQKTKIHPDYIHDCSLEEDHFSTKPNAKIIWAGAKPW